MSSIVIQLPQENNETARIDEVNAPTRVVMQIEHVTKTYAASSGVMTALRDVSLDVRDNELFTLLGPSGCGKTTLLRILAGFEQPSRGTVRLDGEDIGNVPPNCRPVNTMFQNYALFPHLTVAKNVAFGLEMLRWKTVDIERRVTETLDQVHMGSFRDRLPAQLSGGQQQRVALARSLAPRPRVLLLDEPLSALDLKLRRAMQAELKRLQRETAVSFVLVTHDQEEALALSDRIAVFNGGELLQVGTPGEIYEYPCNRFVADFVGEANVIAGPLLGEADGLSIAIRPERIRLSGGARDRDRIIEGRVTAITYLGAEYLVEVSIGEKHTLRARLRGGTDAPQSGDAVYVSWPLESERRLLR